MVPDETSWTVPVRGSGWTSDIGEGETAAD